MMRSAEEWEDVLDSTEDHHGYYAMPIQEFVRAIQADAIEAAALCAELALDVDRGISPNALGDKICKLKPVAQ